MISPFQGFENAVITLKLPSGTHRANSTGNRIPDFIETIIKAVLKPSPAKTSLDQTEIKNYVGVDGCATLMEGYLVEPMIYPQGMIFPCETTAKIITRIGREETGKFKILPIIQSPYTTLLGISQATEIRGLFKK